jgi:hypothetical protein
MIRFATALLAFTAAAAALPAAAQQPPATVSAADPDGIARALRFAGYSADLKTDSVGDPMIETEFANLFGSILFYECDEETHAGCSAIQLRVGLDRDEPMSLEMLNGVFGNDRFYAVHLDDEGDPWFNWDIVTGSEEGIPTSVFLLALKEFSTQVGAASAIVFAEESEKDVNFSDPAQREADTI